MQAMTIEAIAGKRFDTLSGGQKRRVSLVLAFIGDPRIVFLDEPTAMLDPKGRREVLETVHKLNKEEGITIVFITHFMEEAVTADRVVVMKKLTHRKSHF